MTSESHRDTFAQSDSPNLEGQLMSFGNFAAVCRRKIIIGLADFNPDDQDIVSIQLNERTSPGPPLCEILGRLTAVVLHRFCATNAGSVRVNEIIAENEMSSDNYELILHSD